MKLSLEKDRPTSLAGIARILFAGVAIGVPILMFVAPLIARHQASTLSPGDLVMHIDPEKGHGDSLGRIVEIRRSGEIVVQRLDGSQFTAFADELHED